MRGTAASVLVLAASFGVSAGLSQTATSAISGIVVTDGSSPQPVTRALVTISAAELRVSRSTLTDGAGAFAFASLPAGRFTLSVSKPAFITTAYGARKAGRPGTPVAVAAGQRVTDLSVALPRGAVVSGTILDDFGEPISGAQVSVIRTDQLTTAILRPMTNASGAFLTDDRGAYRVFGLAPGEYVVVAAKRIAGLNSEAGRMSEAQIDAALRDLQASRGRMNAGRAATASASTTPLRNDPTYSFAPVYFPGTSNAAEAAPVILSAGEERAGLDFPLRPIRTSVVEGVVTNPNGPLLSVSLSLDAETGPGAGNTLLTQLGLLTAATVDADGRFKLSNIVPGRYRLYARTGSNLGGRGAPGGAARSASDDAPLWAAADVAVTGERIQGLSLVLQPALSFSGRLEFTGTTAQPSNLTTLRVALAGIAGGAARAATVLPTAVRPDGSFQASGILPGTYRPSVAPAPAGWWLRSAVVNGKDALDAGLEFGAAGNVTGAVFTYTDRHSELSGTLQTPAGSPATDYVVVVFPTDRSFWLPQARRVRSTVPATDGRFVLNDLPGGDYHLAALTDVEPSDLDSPSFLAQIVAASVRVGVVDGEKISQNLRIAK